MSSWRVIEGDCIEAMRGMDEASVQCVVTSPPYWGLRDYGTATWEGGDAACDHVAPPSGGRGSSAMNSGESHERWIAKLDGTGHYRNTCGKCGAVRIDAQLGLEATPEQYVERMVEVFREVRRVLRDDGTVWLNLGDSYASQGQRGDTRSGFNDRYFGTENGVGKQGATASEVPPNTVPPGLKPKDLVGIPWRVAFALQADGWYLRSDIIWAKPNPMPESVTDRPTKSHEYVFLLSKSARYYWDADAVREPTSPRSDFGRVIPAVPMPSTEPDAVNDRHMHIRLGNGSVGDPAGRNLRSVWNIATEPFPGAHFATFPKKLVEPCVKAGTSEKGCCAECGAPIVRMVERTPMVVREGPGRQGLKDASESATQRTAITGTMLEPASSTTTGWVPGCTHHESAIVPCVVLDPFCGSGTTGLVSLRLGRSFVGIELNPAYAEMARTSIATDRSRDGTGSLFNVASEVYPEGIEG